jgi:hypothetical protein
MLIAIDVDGVTSFSVTLDLLDVHATWDENGTTCERDIAFLDAGFSPQESTSDVPTGDFARRPAFCSLSAFVFHATGGFYDSSQGQGSK